jgi:transcriptional regulator with XRE-family HTH domain
VSDIGARIRETLALSQEVRTQTDLAAQVGMTPDALSRSVNGQRGWSISELLAIATKLGTSVHWLATGTQDPFAVEVAARHGFDHDAKVHAAVDWESARSVLDDVALAYEQVQPWIPAGNSRDDLAGLTALQTHEALVRQGGSGFARHLGDVVAATFGVDVVRVAGVKSGYSMVAGQQKIIVVSDTTNWFFQNWSIAHELGHFAASSMRPIDAADGNVTLDERAANAFAAELLMPEARLREMHWPDVPIPEVGDFVWTNGVSTKSLLTRLKALKLPVSPDLETALDKPTQRFLRSYSPLVRGAAVDEISIRMAEASTRRFPMRLLTAHRDAIELGHLPATTLGWMLGDDPETIAAELRPEATFAASRDVDELASILGLTS